MANIYSEIIHATDKPTGMYFNAMARKDERDQYNQTMQTNESRYRDSQNRFAQERKDRGAKEALSTGIEIARGLDPANPKDRAALKSILDQIGGQYGLEPVQDAGIDAVFSVARNNVGEGVYGTPIYGQDKDGNTIVMNVDKQGGSLRPAQIPEGVRITPPVSYQDLGGTKVPMDRFGNPAGPALKVTPKPQDTPEYRQEVTTAEERAKNEEKKRVGFPKVRDSILAMQEDQALIERTVQQAIALADEAAGYKSIGKVIPASKARTLESLLKTLKATVGFNYLQDMRQNSPTGGAVGSLSEREFDLLAATAGSLDQELDPDVLKQNLEHILKRQQRIVSRVMSAYESDYGDMIQPDQNTAPVQTGVKGF